MSLFLKQYFSLNNSLSKNILICLKRKEGQFSAVLHIFGEKDGLSLSLGQYETLVSEKNNVLAYMDGGVGSLEFDIPSKDAELSAIGRKAQCPMLLMRQVDKLSGKVSVVCLAKKTYERLVELSKLIVHLMSRLEKSVPECEKLFLKCQQNDALGINEHGLDLAALEMELNLFEQGVKDNIFK